MSDKIWYAVEVEIARVGEAAATTQLWVFNTTGVEISDDAKNPDFITLRAYFNSAPDSDKLREQILRNLKLIDLPEFALRGIRSLTVADQDWLAEWKKGYEPIAIGESLLICPSWRRDQARSADRVVVEIDPGTAFGTGTHETTRGCLEMLEKYWKGGSLLDVGTGTGILVIAAIKLQPGSRVVGFDVDPEAVEVALENAAINGVADEIEIEVNKLGSYHGQEFDLVLANLTADAIIPLSPEFPRVLKPSRDAKCCVSTLIVSGVLREQSDDVRAALESHDLSVIEMKPDGEWMTMALQIY